jgi:hypothetical protein
MRVGIYLVPLLDHVTGRERVVQGLLDALARLDGANDYYLFVRPGNRRLFQRPEPNFHTVVVRLPSLPSRRLWQLGHLYLARWAHRLDVIDLPESPMPGFFREMVARGLRRTREFTWDRVARNFLLVYREVTGGG